MKREPALIIGLIVAAINLLLRSLDVEGVDDALVQSVASFLVILGGAILTRAKVMPVATIKDAGLSPKAVEQRADDREILPYRGE